MACPVCGDDQFELLASAAQLAEECRERERFIAERLPRPVSASEQKDLTDFFHSEHADILFCTQCTLLVRRAREEPPAKTYSDDSYDPAVMDRLYPRYLAAFQAKEEPYRRLVAKDARVLEIGSHYGAFLDVAQTWGWEAEGVDIGEDTSRFARSRGLTVHTCDVSECRFPGESFDAVFVWNCYEQIEDPQPLLREVRRILKPRGLLTVRTPNGLFYRLCRALLRRPDLPGTGREFVREALGYNNLLGFPYLYGHNPATLSLQAGTAGFKIEGKLNSELLTLPLPEQPRWVIDEEGKVSNKVRTLADSLGEPGADLAGGPWVEVWFR
jgi:SAM-dependent methyltransferase